MALPGLTAAGIGVSALANLAGGLSRARQLYSPEIEREMRRQQELRDESARQFAQEARAGQAGQMLDVQQAAQQQAALMGAQGGFTGREQMNAALALQEQRAAQEQALRAQMAQQQMQLDLQKAQENAALAQRQADARAARVQAVAGTLGTAAVQGVNIAQQMAAMEAQQSFQQELLRAMAEDKKVDASRMAAEQSLGSAAQGAFQPMAVSAGVNPFPAVSAKVSPDRNMSAGVSADFALSAGADPYLMLSGGK